METNRAGLLAASIATCLALAACKREPEPVAAPAAPPAASAADAGADSAPATAPISD